MKNHKKHENVATCNFQKKQKCGRETSVKHPWTTVKLRESTLFTVNARLKKYHIFSLFSWILDSGEVKNCFMRELREHIYVFELAHTPLGVLVARSSWLGSSRLYRQHEWQTPWKSCTSLTEGKRNATAAGCKDWTMISNRPRYRRELNWHLDCVANKPGRHKITRERHNLQDF